MDTKKASKLKRLTPSLKQINFLHALEDRHQFKAPSAYFSDYSKMKLVLDRFAFKPEADDTSGYEIYNEIWRVVIQDTDESYAAKKLNQPIRKIIFLAQFIEQNTTRPLPKSWEEDEIAAYSEDDAYSSLAYI